MHYDLVPIMALEAILSEAEVDKHNMEIFQGQSMYYLLIAYLIEEKTVEESGNFKYVGISYIRG